jgi:hypothetical protein
MSHGRIFRTKMIPTIAEAPTTPELHQGVRCGPSCLEIVHQGNPPFYVDDRVPASGRRGCVVTTATTDGRIHRRWVRRHSAGPTFGVEAALPPPGKAAADRAQRAAWCPRGALGLHLSPGTCLTVVHRGAAGLATKSHRARRATERRRATCRGRSAEVQVFITRLSQFCGCERHADARRSRSSARPRSARPRRPEAGRST